jgi:hypothetical protein
MEQPSGLGPDIRGGSDASKSPEKGMEFLKLVRVLLTSLKSEVDRGKAQERQREAQVSPGKLNFLEILRKIFSTQKRETGEPQSGAASSPVEFQDVSDKNRRVALIAEEYATNRKDILGQHCWDWVDKVYKAAGVKMKTIYQDLKYEGRDCGSHHAGPRLINQLEPGDWIYANNKNKSDTHGNHSLVFLGWLDRTAGVAKVASCPGYRKPGRVHTINIVRCPIVHISKPV